MNHPNATCFGDLHGDCVTQLHSFGPVDEQLRTATPNHRFYLAFHNYPVPNEELFQPGVYNHFSSKLTNKKKTHFKLNHKIKCKYFRFTRQSNHCGCHK